jgi:hypothetical protein
MSTPVFAMSTRPELNIGATSDERGARAIVARFRDDTSGILRTRGSPRRYELTTSQGFGARDLPDKTLLAFELHVANGPYPMLVVDSVHGHPLVLASGQPPEPGALHALSIYSVAFDAKRSWLKLLDVRAATELRTAWANDAIFALSEGI